MILLSTAGCDFFLETQSPSPTPINIQNPTNTISELPDLALKETDIQINSDDICDTENEFITTRVTIINEGVINTGPFIVAVNNAIQQVDDGLPAGGMVFLVFPANEKATIYIDSANQVLESDEQNNLVEREFIIPSPPAHCLQTPTPSAAILDPIKTMEGHTAAVTSLDFSPDGHILATGSIDNTLRLWRIREASLLRTMRGHPFPVLSVKFTPDGVYLVTGSTDGLIRLWSVTNGRLSKSLSGHAGWIHNLDISHDGSFIVSSADDFTVRVWRIADGIPVQTIDEGMTTINDVIFSSDDRFINWVESNGNIRIRTLDGHWTHKFKGSDIEPTAISVSPDGLILVAGYMDGSIKVWDIANEVLIQSVQAHRDKITALVFSLNGGRLASGSNDHTARIWAISKKPPILSPEYILAGHFGPVNSIDFSPDGLLLASGSDDSTVRLWEIPSQK